MDIQILRDGQQTGPYTEEAVQAMLKEGRVLINDLAWRPGLTEWAPLMNVLYPAATQPAPTPPAPEPTPATEAAPREPATARQKAFLDYVGVAFAPEISKDDASLLVNDAMEHPKDQTRLARWNDERLQLHPELFAAEIQAKKEKRPQRFLEICHDEGAHFFEKVTKAHCQVLVAHLDVHAPNWDAHEREAAAKYFFPALAEKFPQLLTETGRGKFKAAEKANGANRPKSSPAVLKSTPSSGPGVGKFLYAVGRGIFLGLLILGLLWAGRGFFVHKTPPPKKSAAVTTSAPAPEAPTPPAPAPAPVEPVAPAPVAEAKTPAAETPEKPAEMASAPAPAAAAPAPAAASPEPAMAAAETKPPEMKPELPEMSGAPAAMTRLIPPGPPGPPRTSVIVTKAVQVPLPPYGQISIPPGTTLKIISQSGTGLTVRYLNHEVSIPANSTDLGTDPVAGATATAR